MIGGSMETLLSDIRYALRTLTKAPAFALVAVLALALGIGANTAIFSVVNAVLLRPLPYPEPEKLVKIWMRFTGIGIPDDRNWVSPPELRDLREYSRAFSGIAAIGSASFNITGTGTPERVEGVAVSAELFRILGVQPLAGRLFLPEEEQPGRDNVVLLGYGLWKRRFGGDLSIAGKTISLNGRNHTVAGVLPPGFQYPEDVEIWRPLAFTPDQLSPNYRGSHGLQVQARIQPGLSYEQALADMQSVSRRIIELNRSYPYERFNFTVLLSPLLDETVGDIRTALWVLMGAVGFVLLIACANIANLLLARATGRQREMAIRAALGAGQSRIIRQLLTESLLLAFAGGAAGLLVAKWGLNALTALASSSFPRVTGAALDARVLAFTVFVSVATGVLFGLAPAWESARSITHESLKEGGRGASAGMMSQRLRRALVVAEVALSLTLLVGAGLLLRSFLKLLDVESGFRAGGVLTARLALPQAKYPGPAQVRSFYRDFVERAAHIPGVDAAGAINSLPLSGSGGSGTTTVDTEAVPPGQRTPEADWRIVTPGYFQAMGIPLLSGRFFDERDTDTSQQVAVIDETMANTYWPNQDAVGQRIKRGGGQSTQPWRTVVGVVRHVRHRTLEARSRVTLYMAHAQNPSSAMSLAVHTSTDPRSLAATLQKQVLAIDPDQPVYSVKTMQELMADSLARRRLSMTLLAIFAGAAMLLAAIGIYGVMSYSVSQRAHEMGIRMALGAGRLDLVRLVLGQSLLLTGGGILLGAAGALALTRLMASLLFGVRAADPPTFLLVAAGLALVALVASYLPARRATQVDPVDALRQE